MSSAILNPLDKSRERETLWKLFGSPALMLNGVQFCLLSLIVAGALCASPADDDGGLALLKSGRVSEAIAQLESVRNRRPDSADVLYTLAQAYFAMERNSDAASVLTDLARRHAKDPAVLTAAGSLLLTHSMSEPASGILAQAEQLDPNNPMLLSLLAKAQLASGHAEASTVTLRHLLSSLKRTPAAENQSSLQTAAATAAALLEANPKNMSQRMLAAEFAFLQSRFTEVVRILSPSRLAAERDPDYFNLLAASYAGLGEYTKAIAAGNQALSISPMRQDLILNLAGVHQKARDNQAAIRILQNAVSKGVRSAEIYFALALSQFNFGSYADAVGNCDRALLSNPDFSRALLLKGRANTRMAHREGAIAAFRSALRIDAGCDYCRYELASQLAEAGDPVEAETLLRQVTQRAPQNAAAQYQLGKLLASRGESLGAIAALEAAVAADRNYEGAWYQLAKLYSQSGESAKAAAAFATVKQIKDQRRSAAETRLPKVNP